MLRRSVVNTLTARTRATEGKVSLVHHSCETGKGRGHVPHNRASVENQRVSKWVLRGSTGRRGSCPCASAGVGYLWWNFVPDVSTAAGVCSKNKLSVGWDKKYSWNKFINGRGYNQYLFCYTMVDAWCARDGEVHPYVTIVDRVGVTNFLYLVLNVEYRISNIERESKSIWYIFKKNWSNNFDILTYRSFRSVSARKTLSTREKDARI